MNFLAFNSFTTPSVAMLLIGAGCASLPDARECACAVSVGHRVEAAYLNQHRLVIALDDDPSHVVASVLDDSVASIEALSAREWNALRADGAPVVVRGRRAWMELLQGAFRSLAPKTAGDGCVVDMLEREELFVYRDGDGDGALRVVPLVAKPRSVPIVCSHRFEALIAALARHETAALYMTGESGYPLVFAGTDRIVFLANVAAPAPVRGRKRGMWGTLLGGQVKSMINRPGSSMARLFTLTAASTKDLANTEPFYLMGNEPAPAIVEREGMDLEEWERALDTMTGSTASRGTLRYHVDGAEFFPRLIDASLSAQRSIDVRTYIFDNDDYAVGYANLLRDRSGSIRVRVLVDSFGTHSAGGVRSESEPAGHVAPRSILRHLRDGSNVDARGLSNTWFAGDHTKAIVIDERTAFVGGMNVGREYRYDWHDLMAELEGPVVSDISDAFARAWKGTQRFSDFRPTKTLARRADATAGDYSIRLLQTRPGDSQILRAQRAAIRRAQSHIYIATPYLTNDELLYELARARRRGVDVRVILPAKGDSALINKSHATAINKMLKHGIRVYLYPGMSHLKAAIYDGWACFGSANLDNLSLRVNREMNIATSHPPAVAALMERVFEPDMERATEVTKRLPTNLSHFFVELVADGL